MIIGICTKYNEKDILPRNLDILFEKNFAVIPLNVANKSNIAGSINSINVPFTVYHSIMLLNRGIALIAQK